MATDEKKATVVMLLDLSAFDSIHHDKLLKILNEEIGVCGVKLQLFTSYLKSWGQQVKIKTYDST